MARNKRFLVFRILSSSPALQAVAKNEENSDPKVWRFVDCRCCCCGGQWICTPLPDEIWPSSTGRISEAGSEDLHSGSASMWRHFESWWRHRWNSCRKLNNLERRLRMLGGSDPPLIRYGSRPDERSSCDPLESRPTTTESCLISEVVPEVSTCHESQWQLSWSGQRHRMNWKKMMSLKCDVQYHPISFTLDFSELALALALAFFSLHKKLKLHRNKSFAWLSIIKPSCDSLLRFFCFMNVKKIKPKNDRFGIPGSILINFSGT